MLRSVKSYAAWRSKVNEMADSNGKDGIVLTAVASKIFP
jgi:hypothetical protein